MKWYYVEKYFYDSTDDIEAVNIHYACTPIGALPDWQHQRATRFMPNLGRRLRRKLLRLPAQIFGPQGNELTDRFLLHHYFEIFHSGYRNYSPLYTEEIFTGAGGRKDAEKPDRRAGRSRPKEMGTFAGAGAEPEGKALRPAAKET